MVARVRLLVRVRLVRARPLMAGTHESSECCGNASTAAAILVLRGGARRRWPCVSVRRQKDLHGIRPRKGAQVFGLDHTLANDPRIAADGDQRYGGVYRTTMSIALSLPFPLIIWHHLPASCARPAWMRPKTGSRPLSCASIMC